MSAEGNIFNFATIGEVFEDGVSLIFDGQEYPTEKHYKVNTSIVFKPKDRVKILSDSGTYVVEYVVGKPKSTEDDNETSLPAGGQKGEALVKDSNDDFAVSWGHPTGTLPEGGSSGQVLRKSAATNYKVEWATIHEVPTGGLKSQCLIKETAANFDTTWGNPNATSIINQFRPTSEAYNIYLQTDSSGNFYIRMGTSGTWKKLSLT